MDSAALFKIGYGLYVVTSRDAAGRDNGFICNTVTQVTATPPRVAVTVNKQNYSHDTIQATGRLNVCVLAESAPFDVFKRFGFQSGRDADKFAGFPHGRGANGLAVLEADANAVFELSVAQYLDLGTHGMFVCDVTEAKTLSDAATMTYAYYFAHVKPGAKARSDGQMVGSSNGQAKSPSDDKTIRPSDHPTKWVCKICGYVYDPAGNDGVAFEDLPADWLCPWCKHPKSDFEPLG